MSNICIKCGSDDFNANGLCKVCLNRQSSKTWQKNNPDKRKVIWTRYTRKKGHQPMSKNRECTLYLGVHIAERVLSKVFDNVARQPNNNPGFDFICGKGFKVDVKSACLIHGLNRKPRWQFRINKNKIAEFFLCLAFDNRNSLTPLHMWLFPSSNINKINVLTSSTNMISKWDRYSLPTTKVSNCCNILKGVDF